MKSVQPVLPLNSSSLPTGTIKVAPVDAKALLSKALALTVGFALPSIITVLILQSSNATDWISVTLLPKVTSSNFVA